MKHKKTFHILFFDFLGFDAWLTKKQMHANYNDNQKRRIFSSGLRKIGRIWGKVLEEKRFPPSYMRKSCECLVND
jgi:hypothetical protein